MTAPNTSFQGSRPGTAAAGWPALALVGFVAFYAGAAVMTFEFIAVRFLQRNFGGSLDVWASEIAVCMGGLALGYWAGGRLADRYASWRVVGKCLVIAGATGVWMELLADGLGDALVPTGPARWHPLVAAGACSFLPLLALGSITPQLIRLHVRSLDKVGASAGWVSAISTFGSIVGVLVTAMALLPVYGVREVLWVLCATLLALGLVLAIGDRIIRRKAATAAAAVVLVALCGAPQARAQVLFEEYTAFHHILVEDNRGTRTLWFDRDPQSTMSLKDPTEGAFEYTDFFHVPMILNPTADSVLFVGLGGGSGPKAFLRDYPELLVDAVEIDPKVVRVAREYFHLPEDNERLRVAVADGRAFLRRGSRQYGAIIIDAYGSGPYGAYIPFHLATTEYFRIVHDRLAHGGCAVYNVMGAYGDLNDYVVTSIHATLSRVFPHVYVFQAASSLNTVFVAQKTDPGAQASEGAETPKPWPEGPWLKHPMLPNGFHDLAVQALEAGVIRKSVLAERVTQFSPAMRRPIRGQVLTDNYAPVDITRPLQRREVKEP